MNPAEPQLNQPTALTILESAWKVIPSQKLVGTFWLAKSFHEKAC